jgi:hypothetical protein
MTRVRAIHVVLVAAAACGGASKVRGPDAAMGDGAVSDGVGDGPTGCLEVGEDPVPLVTAGAADEYALAFVAHSASATTWGTAGNEAVILEIAGAQGLIGHVILHQGARMFDYAMHTGALAANEALMVSVSKLSAAGADHHATVCSPALVGASMLGPEAAGLVHAPIFRWPLQKAFDDVPLVVGWSRARAAYQTVMTNENGGTAQICGGGASGMQAEIARWGRSTDIEEHYAYGGASPTWARCTGRVAVSATPLRMEADHPLLYRGDGHNRLFESRGGYGQTCGSAAPEKPDGDLAGWNTQNPSNALADDVGRVIILRPLPVELDLIGYAQFLGRREAISDRYAPWIYRLASLELEREQKIDNAKTFPMARYLYVDVRVADVGGTGDSYCQSPLTGGFRLRVSMKDTTVVSAGQITAAYASNGAHDWKRVAIPLPAGVTATDIDHFMFDAYDGDGIYVTAIGDAFIASPEADNGAHLDYVRQGEKPLALYVDDNSNGCTNGINTAGPGGTPYTCTGSTVRIDK